MFVLFLRNFTEPSQSRTLAPPGWKLFMLNEPGFWPAPLPRPGTVPARVAHAFDRSPKRPRGDPLRDVSGWYVGRCSTVRHARVKCPNPAFPQRLLVLAVGC